MDDETAFVLAALQKQLSDMQARLDGRAAGNNIIHLKQAAFDAGVSVETMRRRIQNDRSWRQQGGRWVRDV